MRIFLFSLFALSFLSVSPLFAHAAVMSISPSGGTVTEGDLLTVTIKANSQGTALNQGDATLRFPADMLDVVSLSKSGSIFTLWVEEPSYSNTGGTVTFDGGVPTPGFNGSNGTIITITFHTKRAGTATLSFEDAALRANDGLGTDVLDNTAGGSFTISSSSVAPVVETPTSTPTPSTTTATPSGNRGVGSLSSPTHEQQDLWYRNNDPLIIWDIPEGATAVQTIVSTNGGAIPSVTYTPAITEKRIEDVEDGISYFNLRARVNGAWGPIASYKLQIDTASPVQGSASFVYNTGTRVLEVSHIDASDALSGIDRFEIFVDDATSVGITPDEVREGTYTLPYTLPGTHLVTLRAYDNAGNYSDVTGTFVVPTPLAEQTLFSVGGIAITLAWFVALVLFISILSLIAAAAAWYRLYILKHGSKTRADKRDKLLHRSLRIYKDELEKHLRTLERAGSKRELTDEEAELNEQLKKNVDELERFLVKEFKKFD